MIPAGRTLTRRLRSSVWYWEVFAKHTTAWRHCLSCIRLALRPHSWKYAAPLQTIGPSCPPSCGVELDETGRPASQPALREGMRSVALRSKATLGAIAGEARIRQPGSWRGARCLRGEGVGIHRLVAPSSSDPLPSLVCHLVRSPNLDGGVCLTPLPGLPDGNPSPSRPTPSTTVQQHHRPEPGLVLRAGWARAFTSAFDTRGEAYRRRGRSMMAARRRTTPNATRERRSGRC